MKDDFNWNFQAPYTSDVTEAEIQEYERLFKETVSKFNRQKTTQITTMSTEEKLNWAFKAMIANFVNMSVIGRDIIGPLLLEQGKETELTVYYAGYAHCTEHFIQYVALIYSQTILLKHEELKEKEVKELNSLFKQDSK
jgi:hypothetical protein